MAATHAALSPGSRQYARLEVRFARDSLVEGDGFEPPVPVAREPVYIAESELWGDRRGQPKNFAGYRWFEFISLQRRGCKLSVPRPTQSSGSHLFAQAWQQARPGVQIKVLPEPEGRRRPIT